MKAQFREGLPGASTQRLAKHWRIDLGQANLDLMFRD
jgi:hypothetical protein